MPSQHSLSLVYLPVPLSLLALTSCLILAPSQAQTIDDAPLAPDESTDNSLPSQNSDEENQQESRPFSGKPRSPLGRVFKSGDPPQLRTSSRFANTKALVVKKEEKSVKVPLFKRDLGGSDASPDNGMARSQDDLALGAYGIRPSKRSVEKEILEGANLAPLQTCGWKLESTYRQPKISQHPASDCLLENAELVADLAPGDRNLPELAQQIPALPSQTRPPQDIEQPRPTQPLPEPPPSAPSSAPVLQLPPPIPTPPEPSAQVPEAITIKGFNFEGNTAISDAELNDVVKKYLNQRIPFATVFEVRSAITKHYTEQGYVNSGAIIPPQTFRESDGILTVQIIEGSLEAIEVRGTRRLNPDYIRNRIALAVGKPVNQRKLTEALRLLQLDPLIKSISAELTAGTQTASGLLIVQVEEAKTISLNLALNNNRSPTIGTFERRLDFLQANLFGQGDGLAFSYSNTDGSNALDATYTYPINPRNGTVSFRTNFTFGHVVESPFDRIDIDANSRYFELGWRQPLTRSLNQEFAIGVLATNQRSKVTIFDVPVRLSPGTEEDGSTTVTALRFFQEWTQRSRNQVFAVRSQFSLGLGVLGATVNKDAPDSRFLAWRGQTQWVRFLAPDTPLILRGDVQVSTDPLLRLEQYGLGGFDTVRGYRENLFLSDNGASASAEVRFPILRLPKQNGLLQIAPFFDAGYIWNNSGNPDPEPDPNSLASVGLGLRFQLGDRLSARVDYGIPLIDVKSSQTTLQDSGLYFSVIYRIF